MTSSKDTNNKRMKWRKLLSAKRSGKQPTSKKINDRSEFEKDIDRVAFSSSFRRLGRKTQVHPLAANDHVHTRLTHSLEVSQVGRTLGKAVGGLIKDKSELPKGVTPNDIGAIVQAACLAHDLGNPPFGHGGEEGMSHWFETNGHEFFGAMSKDYQRDLISFEGNAQGFRIITQLENHLFDGGLCLTYATLGAFQKYPWSSRVPGKKFGAYISEEKILETIATELGLIRSKRKKHKHEKHGYEWCRHPLAFLVEAADDICYSFLDIEDAVELKILRFDDISGEFCKYFTEKEWRSIRAGFNDDSEFRVNLARLRGRLFDKAISGAVDGFKSAYDDIMKGRYNGNLYDQLDNDDLRKDMVQNSKKYAQDNIFDDRKKVEIELGCYSTFEVLLDNFCRAALEASQYEIGGNEISIGWKSNLVLKLLGDHAPNKENTPPHYDKWTQYECLRRVIDYVSGMTDNYATYISGQLQGMGFSGTQRP